ncbi:hypothetical protein C2857_007038 [Epichloe festucae Fl1]|uniref:Bola-like protein n=1 Tax=Epichloe festucae (strain Fl1) TaxID=877507 RepID=A0A7S9PWI3_EPIFF|nr:hypothetical protein C2857_007038 [Epichloe festucae Fl1]
MICPSRRAATRLVRTLGIPPRRIPPKQPPPRRPAPVQTTQRAAHPRFYSQTPEEPSMSTAEQSIADLLRRKLRPTELLVRDVSGGCGSMYAIDIASPAFKGATMLKQQRMVNAALGDVMKGWHGVQLNTRVSE